MKWKGSIGQYRPKYIYLSSFNAKNALLTSDLHLWVCDSDTVLVRHNETYSGGSHTETLEPCDLSFWIYYPEIIIYQDQFIFLELDYFWQRNSTFCDFRWSQNGYFSPQTHPKNHKKWTFVCQKWSNFKIVNFSSYVIILEC